jgi:hypothetical protein
MNTTAQLHGGPLDGTVRTLPSEPNGEPAEITEFDYDASDATWYVEYRRTHRDESGWHYEATGNQERPDED